MRVLAIDTALEACAAAVLDTVRGEIVSRESKAMARGHAEALMPLVKRVMERSGYSFSDLNRIAVTVGPGSFTGPRGRTLVMPRLANLRDALRASTTSRAPRLVGNAAAWLAANWPARERRPASVDQRGAPEIDWVAKLGAAAPDDTGPPRPLYLR